MSDLPDWMKVFREPNALGWIAFLVLVIAIGVGTILFGDPPAPHRGNPMTVHRTMPAK